MDFDYPTRPAPISYLIHQHPPYSLRHVRRDRHYAKVLICLYVSRAECNALVHSQNQKCRGTTDRENELEGTRVGARAHARVGHETRIIYTVGRSPHVEAMTRRDDR